MECFVLQELPVPQTVRPGGSLQLRGEAVVLLHSAPGIVPEQVPGHVSVTALRFDTTKLSPVLLTEVNDAPLTLLAELLKPLMVTLAPTSCCQPIVFVFSPVDG
jgi:hypothetical protein